MAYSEGSEAHLGAISDLFGAYLESLEADLVPIWGLESPFKAYPEHI